MSTGTIADRSPDFEEDHERRELCLALAEGLPALQRDGALGSAGAARYEGSRAGPQKWVWPRPGEMERVEVSGKKTTTVYDLKLKAARLLNIWYDSLRAAAAVPFTESPTLEGWPDKIQGEDGEDGKPDLSTGFRARVDDRGSSLTHYMADVFLRKLVCGVHYTLVDMDPEPGGDAYWSSICADAVLEVRADPGSRRDRAVYARVAMPRSERRDTEQDPDDFDTSFDEQEAVRSYRIGDADVVEWRDAVFTKGASGGDKWLWDGPWQPIEGKGGPITEIPLVPHYAHRAGPFRGRPPFADTARQQAAHFRKMLDYDERVRRDAVNLIAISGATPGDVTRKGNRIFLPESGRAELLETTGAALANLRDDLDIIAQAIRIGNMRPMLSQPSKSATATEITVYHLASMSLLEMWVLMELDAIRQALQFTAWMEGLVPGPDEGGGSIHLPHDFTLNPVALDRLWRGYLDSGGELVPPEVIWPELRRHRAISDAIDLDRTIELVKGNITTGLERESVSRTPSIPQEEED